jgi:homoserine kinase
VMIPAPRLFASVLHPQIEVRTAEARAMLPAEVPLRTAVRQWSNLGAFVAALAAGDVSLLSRSMEDLIVEPVRSRLIPEFPAVKAAGLAAGAIGGGISGSGPSVFMLSDDNETAEAVASAMADAFSATGIPANIHVSPISSQGAGPVGGNA